MISRTQAESVISRLTMSISGNIAMWLLESKKIQVKPMISNVIPLGDIQELLKPDTTWVQAVVAFE